MAFVPKELIEGATLAGGTERDSGEETDEVTATRLKRSADGGWPLVVAASKG